MKYSIGIWAVFVYVMIALPDLSLADPPKFPDFPDSPNPGGEGGGGDHVPYIPHVDYFVTRPIVSDGTIVNRHVRFSFRSSGPLMRYNIIWSRPGKKETDMRWVKNDPHGTSYPSIYQEYIINEPVQWDTDYSFKVQAESMPSAKHNNGVVWSYQITPFVEKTFHTPPNPLIKTKANTLAKGTAAVTPDPKPAPNPFKDKVDNEVQLIPHPK